MDDPVGPVEAILSRCSKMQIMKKYCVPDYNSTVEFLVSFAKRLGKLKKGNVVVITTKMLNFLYRLLKDLGN